MNADGTLGRAAAGSPADDGEGTKGNGPRDATVLTGRSPHSFQPDAAAIVGRRSWRLSAFIRARGCCVFCVAVPIGAPPAWREGTRAYPRDAGGTMPFRRAYTTSCP